MIEGLNRVVDRLEHDLGASPDIEELAQLARTSSYHLRRMFSSLAGMPLSVYVRRRRMTLAAAQVVAGRASLLEIAVRHGYGSTEAFGRAFRDVHGVSPAEARERAVALISQPRLRFRLTVEGDRSMRHRIVTKEPFTIVGKHVRVPLIYEGVNPHITEFIGSLPASTHERLKELSDQEPAGILAVTYPTDPTREEGSDVDYYHATITSQPVPDDLDHLEVGAHDWAVFEVEGPFPETLQQLWADTAAVWFPSNPYRMVDAPELVRMDLSEDQRTATCELWIPVEPTGG